MEFPRSLHPPDPRSASQVSIEPASTDATKRTLLVVYIHGFMGNETSFQAFPAHLHNLLCVTLAPFDYLVHTKVYPKFKTRHYLLAAAQAFSRWLSSFECDTTDVVLLGHSMGGLLAAEVALILDSAGRNRHRLLGIVSFDTPFLGMDPGIITSGISSLFRSSPTKSPPPNQSTTTTTDDFFSHTPQRNFSVAARKPEGPWESTLHFIDKHHTSLTQATTQYFLSHLEFGACLADPIGLRKRYVAVRQKDFGFVNYYTASTGRTKEPPTCDARPREKEKEEKVKEQSEKTPSEQESMARQARDSEVKKRQELEQDQEQDHEKRELARLSHEQARMDAEHRRMNGIPEPPSPSPSPPPPPVELQPAPDDGDTAHEPEQHDSYPEPSQPPKKRERHFCLLPHDAENNSWVKVPMDGVDEVGAHCGLFVLGPVYERLVGDVAGRVEAWVGEEVSWRVAGESEVA